MLRRRLNATESRIYRLHPELLSLVASYLPRKTLVKATHVSHSWRAILISFPRLWTNLNFIYRKEALAFLERSKSTPISVFMAIPFGPDLDTAYDFLDQHAKRIERLTIAGISCHSWILLPPLPSLTEFEFSWDYPQPDGPAEWITLPTVTTLTVRGGDGDRKSVV